MLKNKIFWLELTLSQQREYLKTHKLLLWEDHGDIGPAYLSTQRVYLDDSQQYLLPYERSRFNKDLARWFTREQVEEIAEKLGLELTIKKGE